MRNLEAKEKISLFHQAKLKYEIERRHELASRFQSKASNILHHTRNFVNNIYVH